MGQLTAWAGRKRPPTYDSSVEELAWLLAAQLYYISRAGELTVREVARRLNRAEETIRRWIRAGTTACPQLGQIYTPMICVEKSHYKICSYIDYAIVAIPSCQLR